MTRSYLLWLQMGNGCWVKIETRDGNPEGRTWEVALVLKMDR